MHTRLLIAFSLLASATSLKAGWFGPGNYAECMSEAIDSKTDLSLKYALEGAKVRCFKEHCDGRLVTKVVRTKEESMECIAAEEKRRVEWKQSQAPIPFMILFSLLPKSAKKPYRFSKILLAHRKQQIAPKSHNS